MSGILELVEELHPDQFVHRLLGEVGEFIRGTGLQKKDFVESGVGCIHYGQLYTFYGTSASETKSFVTPDLASKLRKAQPGDLVIATTSENSEDVCKAVAWLGDAEIAVSGDAYIFRHNLDPLFAAYLFQTESFSRQKSKYVTGTKVKRVSGDALARIRVPVPPVATQEKIAGIISTFEGLNVELEANLKAEIKARRQQHTHFSKLLLQPSDLSDRQVMNLGEISTNLDSQRRPVKKELRVAGNVPYYGASGVVDFVDDFIFDGDYLLVSEDGANLEARRTPIAFSVTGKTWVNNHAHVLEFETRALQRFVEFYLNSIDLSRFISTATQPKLSKKSLDRIPIPLPSTVEQERIVEYLDSFERLTAGLTSDLAAEINTRREQYEHYRDQLLAFPEAAP